MAIVAPHTLWPGSQSVSQGEFAKAGTKILLIETRESGIHWMEPRDLGLHEAVQIVGTEGPHRGSRHVAFGDGSIGTLTGGRLTVLLDPKSFISEWATR